MGAVYEVVDEKTAGSRALKVMLPSLVENEGLRARFALEARITGGIESDHIVKTFDAGVDEATGGTPFLVMELLRGEDLGALLKRRKVLMPLEAAIYLSQASRALDKTHAASIIHRDLKPDNLFLTHRDDGSPCVKILDFGIAKVKLSPDPSIKTRPMMGTPLYMSPEQVRNERDIGPAADIYALGHIAYILLVGESYWAEESETINSPFLLISEMMQGVKELPKARAERRRGVQLPAAFDAWFKQATALAAENRFDRASEAIEQLADALSVPLPRAPLPSFELNTSNPVGGGEESMVSADQTTADLGLSASMESLVGRPGVDTPTAVTGGHSRVGQDSASMATSPSGTGLSRSRSGVGLDRASMATSPSEPGLSRSRPVPQTTGVAEGPASSPISSTSPWRSTRESTQQPLAASGEAGRAPASVRAKAPSPGATYDKGPPPTVARERSASSPVSMERSGASTTFRSERALTPNALRTSTTSSAVDREPPSQAPSHRAPTPSPSVRRPPTPSPTTLGRDPAPPLGRDPASPPTVRRDRPASSTGVREPTPPLAPSRDKTFLSKSSTSLRDTGPAKKDAPVSFRFQISADLARSILRVKVWGFWSLEEAKAYWEEFQQKAKPLLGRRWYVLADISDFPPQKPEVTAEVEKTMGFARAHGMVSAANLVSNALPKMHIARLSADMGLPAYSFFSVESEAIAWLLKG